MARLGTVVRYARCNQLFENFPFYPYETEPLDI